MMKTCLSFLWALRLVRLILMARSQPAHDCVVTVRQQHAWVPAFHSASHQILFFPLIVNHTPGIPPKKRSVCREVDKKLRRNGCQCVTVCGGKLGLLIKPSAERLDADYIIMC